MIEKRTILEWCEIKNITMIDPDGFDRTDKKVFERLFTEEEFNSALWKCTIRRN